MDENQDPHNRSSQVLQAYERFVPHQLLRLIGKDDITEIRLGDQVEKSMTILFADIRDFTRLSESMSPRDTFRFINSYLGQMEPAIDDHHGIIDKFIGDAIMALFPQSPDHALAAAVAILKQLKEYNEARRERGYSPIHIGIGLNTGLMMLGTIGGVNRMESTVISDAVNLASRIESLTKVYGVNLLISEHTYFSLDPSNLDHIRFIDRVLVKGKMRPQSVYEVFGSDPEPIRTLKKNAVNLFEEAIADYHFKDVARAEKLLQRHLRTAPEDRPAQVYMERCRRYMDTGVHETSGELEYTITWDPSKTVYHPLLDRQHQRLFQDTNTLIEAVRQGNPLDDVEMAFSELHRSVVTHFRDEEAIMQANQYPFFDFQKEQHDRFLRYFSRLKKEVLSAERNRVYLLFRITIFIVDWLANHTTKEDLHLGVFLKNKAP